MHIQYNESYFQASKGLFKIINTSGNYSIVSGYVSEQEQILLVENLLEKDTMLTWESQKQFSTISEAKKEMRKKCMQSPISIAKKLNR